MGNRTNGILILILAVTDSYEFLCTDRQYMFTICTLGSNAFPRHEKDCKPITLPLTRNRELSAADVQYTKPFNTQ